MRNLFLLSILILFFSCGLLEPIDDLNPSLIINYPEDNMQLSIRDTIKITALDEFGIKKVKCEVIDSLDISIVEDIESPFELPISFLESHEDSISISCEAYDENNNISKTHSIKVYINNDINPSNGFHDGDEIFKNEILDLNQISNTFSEENITWENINNLNRLTEIKYRNVDIDSIPNSIENLSQLTHLEFINNGLINLPNSFNHLLTLKSIRIQNNNLIEISCIRDKQIRALLFVMKNKDYKLYWIDVYDNNAYTATLYNYIAYIKSKSLISQICINLGRGDYNWKIKKFRPEIHELYTLNIFSNIFFKINYIIKSFILSKMKSIYIKFK